MDKLAISLALVGMVALLGFGLAQRARARARKGLRWVWDGVQWVPGYTGWTLGAAGWQWVEGRAPQAGDVVAKAVGLVLVAVVLALGLGLGVWVLGRAAGL